jgi:multiple sugar transport system ATP-binding protein
VGELRLDGVTVAFGDGVPVRDVDLLVRDGELLVLVGPSGCGKTTLLRTVAGLEAPTEGEILLDGRRVTDLPARRRDVGFVFQDFALFPHLDVRENLSFNLRMQGYDRVDERVAEVADLLEIDSLLDRSVEALSGGQKGRVALGRAIVTEPTAFLLDEPLANLDAGLRERMRTEIARLQADLGVTTVHVTHDQGEALSMGDRVAVMNDGRIEQVGTPEEIYREPASLFVARFVGSPSMNLLRGRYDPDARAIQLVGDGRAAEHSENTGHDDVDTTTATRTADEGTVLPVDLPEVQAARSVDVGVRPEAITVDRAVDRDQGTDRDRGTDRDGAANRDRVAEHERVGATATVRFEEFHGADRFLYLDAPGLPELVTRVESEADIAVGDEVVVDLPVDRLHLFDGATGRRLEASTRAGSDAAEPPEGEPP